MAVFRKKKKLGAFPTFSVVISLSLALIITGLLGVVALMGNNLTVMMKENIEVQVFLQRGISTQQKQELAAKMVAYPFLRSNNGRPDIQFISKDEAAKKLIAETGEDFVRLLGENPLRDAFVFKVDQAYAEPDSLKQIKASLEAEPHVFEVVYLESLVDLISKNITSAAIVLGGISMVFFFAALLLIRNTIRLAMYSQRFLVRSMQLVGASPWFIKKPFIYRASLLGLISGGVAILICGTLVEYAIQMVPELNALLNLEELSFLGILLLFLGGAMGAFSAQSAVNKYLKLSLDQLY